MGRRPDPETNRRAELAAYLAGELKLSHTDIARRMDVTASAVSRLLSRAVGLGCYTETVVREFIPESVTKARLDELSSPSQPQQLQIALESLSTETGVRVRRVHALPGPTTRRGDSSFDEAYLTDFGRSAALRVAELISDSRIVAVTWGTTLSRIVDGLSVHAKRLARNVPQAVIPVCPEVEEFMGRPESSSSLAFRITDIVRPNSGVVKLSLNRVPAFIPRALFGSERERGVREMIWSSKAYGKIFGVPNKDLVGGVGGFVDRADMLLTSVGSADHPMGFNYEELLRAGRITTKRLKQLVVGDIGGILIHRPGSSERRHEVRQLNRMWTGLEYARLENLVRRAARTPPGSVKAKPGCVVVSCGHSRHEILEAIVRRGLANELILDLEAATALSERLGA
jgi:DNA-binding transcriptional regulator LsrR (DeoR family)